MTWTWERLPTNGPNLCAIYLRKGVSSWCKQRINTNLKRCPALFLMIATNVASASVIPVIKYGWRVLLLPLYNEDSSIK